MMLSGTNEEEEEEGGRGAWVLLTFHHASALPTRWVLMGSAREVTAQEAGRLQGRGASGRRDGEIVFILIGRHRGRERRLGCSECRLGSYGGIMDFYYDKL